MSEKVGPSAQHDNRPHNDTDDHFPTIGIDVKAIMKYTSSNGWTFEVRMHVLGPDDVMFSESESFASKRDCAYALMGEWQSRTTMLWNEYNEVPKRSPEGSEVTVGDNV